MADNHIKSIYRKKFNDWVLQCTYCKGESGSNGLLQHYHFCKEAKQKNIKISFYGRYDENVIEIVKLFNPDRK